jgi:hypothetical protein
MDADVLELEPDGYGAPAALIHHSSEVCLSSDLCPHTKPATNGATR